MRTPSLSPLPRTLLVPGRCLPALLLAVAVAVAPAALAAKEKPSLLEGKVTDKQGTALAGVRVVIASVDHPEMVVETETKRDGEFKLEIPDPVGKYVVRFEKETFTAHEEAFEPQAGMKHRADIQMLDLREGQAVQAYNEATAEYTAGVKERKQDVAKTKLAAAKEKLLAALAAKPDLFQAHLLLADIYFREAAYADAASSIELYLAKAPSEPQVQVLAFEIYDHLGDPAKRQPWLDLLSGTEQGKDIAPEIYNQGVAALRAKDQAKAKDRFETARALDPTLPAVYVAFAQMAYDAAKYQEAVAELDKLLAIAPTHAAGLKLRYFSYDALGDDAKAAEAFDAYGKVDAAGALEVLQQAAERDFKADRYKEAEAAWLKVLTLSPDLPKAHYSLGLCYAAMRQNDKAKLHLRRFLELAPQDGEAEAARGMLSGL